MGWGLWSGERAQGTVSAEAVRLGWLGLFGNLEEARVAWLQWTRGNWAWRHQKDSEGLSLWVLVWPWEPTGN